MREAPCFLKFSILHKIDPQNVRYWRDYRRLNSKKPITFVKCMTIALKCITIRVSFRQFFNFHFQGIKTMKKYKTLKRSKVLPLIQEFVQRHAKFKNSFFWTPPCNASGRRKMEEDNSLIFSFMLGGISYSFEQGISCSCKNVYYSSSISVNGQSKDIRVAKKLLSLYVS